MNPWLYFSKATNSACHDLRTGDLHRRSTYHSVISLGLNFIPRRNTTTSPNDIDITRFQRDAYTKFLFCNAQTPKPRLFLRTNYFPDKQQIDKEFIARVSLFTKRIVSLFYKRKIQSNLLPFQRSALHKLRGDANLVIMKTDKNLGPAIIYYDEYVKRALQEHLLDKKTYANLSSEAAHSRIKIARNTITNFLQIYNLRDSDKKYIKRWLDQGMNKDPFSYFYLLAKVHKTPMKTRPIVSSSGGIMFALSKWVDEELKKIVKELPFTLTSSSQLVDELKALGPLPPIYLSSADATSMYTNIDSIHALKMIREFLSNNPDIVTKTQIDIAAVTNGLRIVMNNNIFKFGDTFWWQKTGTAMGTPLAPSYATLYFAIHELTFVHKFPDLLYYRRYLDDTLCIWKNTICTTPSDTFEEFNNSMNDYGQLRWTSTPLSDQVDFLDITITQNNDGTFDTDLYEKALNTYLYLPPHSAHAPGVLKGLIIGMIKRIVRLTSNRTNINKHIQNLYHRLLQRGYKYFQLCELFNTTIDRVNASFESKLTQQLFNEPNNKHNNTKSSLFFHLPFHPKDPASNLFQRTFRNTFSQPPNERPSEQITNANGIPCGVNRVTVAYSIHRNLSNYVSIRKLNNLADPVSATVTTLTTNRVPTLNNPP